ncbi:MAG: RluA family pseudouridine synthase [Planctomycetes bacterium]|nr:RluA family pseudouridine synthase [Planctomycetota bacterium]MBU4398571.1 RluA family pseudouridine synthase [Planctomycetota bacterium]MCG2682449.1 RluA family pseudouridine synthase [Planctomycetales bacterium]
MSLSLQPVELTVGAAEAGLRLDAFLASHFADYSRVHLRRIISAGGVKVDGRGGKPAYRLKPGQRVSFVLPKIPRESPSPENIPLDVLYEDEHLAVVNKPPDMVVHPARGHWSGTLASALQFRFGTTLSAAGGASRPGIVHRLDRDTSGAILVARNDRMHAALSRQFADRQIEKEYFALVSGRPPRDRDLIDSPIGFHPRVREKMAIRRDDSASRPAQTFYEVLERFDGFAALGLLPKTGRTHQIRVHLNHVGFPVLCDRQYGGRRRITRGEIRREPADELVLLERQALHARRLRFTHPATGQAMEIEAPLPSDIAAVLEELRAYRAG